MRQTEEKREEALLPEGQIPAQGFAMFARGSGLHARLRVTGRTRCVALDMMVALSDPVPPTVPRGSSRCPRPRAVMRVQSIRGPLQLLC